MKFEYCNRCRINTPGELLREIAYAKNRSTRDILKQAQQTEDSRLYQVSRDCAAQREKENAERLRQYEEKLRQLEEDTSYDALDRIMQGEEIDEVAEWMLADEVRKQLEEMIRALRWKPQGMSEDDVRQALEEFERQGYIEIREGRVNITSKGAKKLASSALEFCKV